MCIYVTQQGDNASRTNGFTPAVGTDHPRGKCRTSKLCGGDKYFARGVPMHTCLECVHGIHLVVVYHRHMVWMWFMCITCTRKAMFPLCAVALETRPRDPRARSTCVVWQSRCLARGALPGSMDCDLAHEQAECRSVCLRIGEMVMTRLMCVLDFVVECWSEGL